MSSTTRQLNRDEYNRHLDIQDWLATHSVNSWVAIDDLPLRKHLDNAVQTDAALGLSDADVRQAIMVLNFQST